VKVYSKEQDPTGTQGVREERDFFFDPDTSLVTAVSDQFHFGNTPDEGIAHEVLYSDYQLKNGIMTPLTITGTVRGVTSFRIKLSQVTFNSGLGDPDFAW
jgi:hypothetical protein